MKQKHLFIALAIVSAALLTGCDTDKSDKNLSHRDITGTWYDPEDNEEIQYISSGRFYDKYCNLNDARYTEGTYEISGNKLKETYSLLGRTNEANLTVTDFVKGNHFTFSSSTIGEHTYYYVSETINMNPGETATAAASDLTSPDARIVTVSGSTLTAAGQKGSVYMRSGDGTYTKVVVGEETHDLWYDYSALLGASYPTVTSTLGAPSQTADGKALYSLTLQSLIQYVMVYLDASNNVEQIELHMRDAVSNNDILSYLEKKYFKLADNNLVGTQYQYYSNSTLADSKFVVAYDTSNKSVLISPRPVNVPDLTPLFGHTLEELKTNGIITDDEIISQGEDSVKYGYKKYGNALELDYCVVYFRGKGHVANSFALHLLDGLESSAVESSLKSQYSYLGTQTVNGINNVQIYSKSPYTLTVLYYPDVLRVEFYDTSIPEDTGDDLWVDRTAFLGKTKAEFISANGEGYEYRSYIVYGISDNDYVDYIYVHVSDEGIIDNYFYRIKEGADISAMKEYLGGKYHLTSGHDDRWTNNANSSNATIGIRIFTNVSPAQLYYFYLGTSSASKKIDMGNAGIDMKALRGKLKTQGVPPLK